MHEPKRTALVAGGTGIIGRRIVETLLGAGTWNLIALARRPRNIQGVRWIQVDLKDFADCERKLGGLSEVTHIYYAARNEFEDGALDSVEINAAMFRNVIDAIEPVARLEHVHAVHGNKYYGQHLGQLPLPLTEDSPRANGRNFYYEQEDFLRARSRGKTWSYTTCRPHILCDAAIDYPRSIGLVIAVYALIQRELGLPLDFPGTATGFMTRMPFTDTRLLARGIAWMSQESKCASQAFNIINGDCLRWSDLWPRFAAYYGMPVGSIANIKLAGYLRNKAELWERIAKKHGLRAPKLDAIALWSYGDRIFRQQWDFESTMTKARAYGFHETLDSGAMFERHFAEYLTAR